MSELALQARLCYNRPINIVGPEGTANTLRLVTHLLRRQVTMNTVPPHAHEGNTFIYVLIDPNTKQVRYVGKANDPRFRYSKHLSDRNDTHKTRWLKKLKAENLKPILEIIEEVPIDQWQERERYWIAFYREQDMPLTNSVEGGWGALRASEETRLKMSVARRRWTYSEETRAIFREQKLKSNPMKGKKASAETRAKMSAARTGMKRVISPAHREKLRQANLGKKLSEDHKAKISASGKGRKSSEKVQSLLQRGREIRRQAQLESARLNAIQKAEKKNLPRPPISEETKRKMSESGKKKIFTEAHRHHLSEASRRRHSRGREDHFPTLWDEVN